MAERIHAVIEASAPALSPKTWYGMPANLDKGTIWPTAFALTELTAADEARIAALVKKAVR